MSRTEIVCVLTIFGAMLAGLALFLFEVRSHELTRQHRIACAEQGLPATECCRVDGAMICPLEGVRP